MEERVCRICGCTEDNACEGGCSWVEEDLCSACVDAEGNSVSDDDQDDAEDVEIIEKSNGVETKVTVSFESGIEKLKSEYKKFKGSGKEAAVSKPVFEALILFCKDYNFELAVKDNPNTISDCIKKTMSGVGNSISDLELYQKAAAFYFPNAKISFAMSIDTDGLDMPVIAKEVIADLNKKNAKSEQSVSIPAATAERKKISINLDELL